MINRVKLNLDSKIRLKKKVKPDPTDKVEGNKHFSVGALIKKNNKYLLIDRNIFPPGYAGIAGHINKNESTLHALKREVKEQTNYSIINKRLLFHEIIDGNPCRTGFITHEWHLFECKCKGNIKILKREEKSIGYYTEEQIDKLYKKKKLEPIWGYWFKKLKIIK